MHISCIVFYVLPFGVINDDDDDDDDDVTVLGVLDGGFLGPSGRARTKMVGPLYI